MKKNTVSTSNKVIGYLMYAFAVLTPLSNLPQISQLFSTKVTAGLSISTWTLYLVLGLIPLTYAIVNNIRPLIVSNVLWIFVDAIMIYGIIVYTPGFLPKDYQQLLLINNIGKAISGIGLLCLSSAFALYTFDLLKLHNTKARA